MAHGWWLLDLQTLPYGALLQILSDESMRSVGMLAPSDRTPHRNVHQMHERCRGLARPGIPGGSRSAVVVGAARLRRLRLALGLLPVLSPEAARGHCAG